MSLNGIENGTSLNGTVILDPDTLYEVKVFNISILSVALCILTITGIITSISYRKRKQARIYESTKACEVVEELVGVTSVRKTDSFRNPLTMFRRQEGPKDNSQIYYIYSNPLPVGHNEDNTPPKTPPTHTPLTLQDYANDPKSGISQDKPIFYTQL